MSKKNTYVFEIKSKPGCYSTQYGDSIDCAIKDVKPSKDIKKAVVVVGNFNAIDVRCEFERLRKVKVNKDGIAIKVID